MTGHEDVPPWVDAAWLVNLGDRVQRCRDRWGLTVGERLGRGNTSRVFRCIDGSRRRLVLKLGPPEMRPDLEAAALSVWNARGAPRLVASDRSEGALLLEEVVPGDHLPPGNDDRATSAVAETLLALHGASAPSGSTFPDQAEFLRTWLGWARSAAESGTAGVRLLGRAEEAARRLCAETTRTVLLHGDFIDKNLLFDGRGYLAVDPLPRIGDPCSDVGFFAAYHPPATNIARRARDLAARCGLDAARAARWAAVWAVGEATQTWREDSDALQAWMVGDEARQLLAG